MLLLKIIKVVWPKDRHIEIRREEKQKQLEGIKKCRGETRRYGEKINWEKGEINKQTKKGKRENRLNAAPKNK